MRRNVVLVGYLEPFNGLTEEGAQKFYRADQRAQFLNELVIDPFKESVLKHTFYTDKKQPEKPTTVSLDGVQYPLRVEVTPTEKRPPTKDVFDDLMFFLDEIERQYNSGVKRPGVVTINEKPYIKIDLVSSRVSEKRQEVTGTGIKQEILLPEIPEEVLGDVQAGATVNLDGRYSRIDDSNLLVYMRSQRLGEHFKTKVINPFEKALKQRTGWSKENLPQESTENFDQVGDHLFRILTIPNETVNYNTVLQGLVGEKTPTGKVGKSTGDITRILEGVEDERTGKYEVSTRGDNKLVSLESLRKRIQRLIEEATDVVIRQPIEHYPLVLF